MLGEDHFHPDTKALLAYGRALAGATPKPGEPTPKKGGADHVLDRLFVLERMRDGRWPLRSFGAELVAVFGRNLKEQDLTRFLLEPDLHLLSALIDAASAANEPGIARVVAETACGLEIEAEILITPLRVEPSFGDRYLGMFQPLSGEALLDGRPLVRLRLRSLHPPLAKAPRGVRLVVVND
jgi:hypothetical protein